MPDRPFRTVAVWNMKVGRGQAAVDGVCEIIDAHDPDAILLQEGKNYVQRLKREFNDEWRIYSGLPFTERANCPVMVRRDVPHGGVKGTDWGVVSNRRTWVYRGKGRLVTHPGRKWTWAIADGVPLMSVHRATEALGYNSSAGKQEARRLRLWFRRWKSALAAGDFNNLWSDRRDHAPADIATKVEGQLAIPAESRIDYAITRGLSVTATRGKRHGSDHHAHIYRIK